MVITGSAYAAEWVMQGTHDRSSAMLPATGKSYAIHGASIGELRDGKIACAGSRSTCPVPSGTEVLDVSGLWITPGLVDAHVHFSQTGWADGRPDALDLRCNLKEFLQPFAAHRSLKIFKPRDVAGRPGQIGYETAADRIGD